jgi:phosphoglycolate phosphatase
MSWQLLSIDLDGTLVDTADEIAEAANRALEEHGIARRPAGEIALLIGAGTRELMLELLARSFLADPEHANRVHPQAVLDSLDRHYTATAGSTAQPYPGCREALRDLRAAGLLLACVTNKELRHAQRVLEATQLADRFDLVIGGDSLPEKKPHASVLRHVAQCLGAATTRSAHLGDSAIDIAAARNAGVAAWAVPYGYNAGRPIAEARPDRIFDNFAEVAAHALQPDFAVRGQRAA